MKNETLAQLSLLGPQGLPAAHCVEVVQVITSAELYAIGMESPTAYLRMPELCEALGIEYPPTQNKGLQPPVSAEFLGATSWVSLHQTTAAATSSASLKASISGAATA